MATLNTTEIYENEIVKEEDFTFAYRNGMYNILTTLTSVLKRGEKDIVIGGQVSPFSAGSMNLRIDSIFVGKGNNAAIDTSGIAPVSVVGANANLDRIDTVQVRGVEETYDEQDRKFKENSMEVIFPVNTKRRIRVEARVKQGVDGSTEAPFVDIGWTKLAEILVVAGSTEIQQANIKNITARKSGDLNTDWTNEKDATFNAGYLSETFGAFVTAHNENGTHKNETIKAAMIKFGSATNEVNGNLIPLGKSLMLLGQEFTSLDSLIALLTLLVTASNITMTYSNQVLSKFDLDTINPRACANVPIGLTGTQVIDGIACTVGQIVFVIAQTDSKQNGMYEVQEGCWNRAVGWTVPEAFINKFIRIRAGTTNTGKVFFLDGEKYIGTDDLIFRESIFSVSRAKKIVLRDENGNAQFSAPIVADDAATKAYTDSVQENLTAHENTTNPHGATATPTADRLAMFDGNGFLYANSAPNKDTSTKVATTSWVRDFVFPVGCFCTQYPGEATPATKYGGTWTVQTQFNERYARAASANNEGWRNAGLPNITGEVNSSSATAGIFSGGTGAFNSGGNTSNGITYDWNYDWTVLRNIYFNINASRSSSIYGNSGTVQPADYPLVIWKRTA